jgi:hypothetical protein
MWGVSESVSWLRHDRAAPLLGVVVTVSDQVGAEISEGVSPRAASPINEAKTNRKSAPNRNSSGG